MLADPNTGAAVIDSYDFGNTTPVCIGGTSLATPMWAGIIALADQGRALAGLGTLDGATQTLPMLYALPSSDFHDITTGNNGYAAGPGFDLVTGLGTPIVNKLVPDLIGNATVPAAIPVIGSFTVNPASVASGAGITLTAASVTETGGTITAVNFYRESNGTSGLQTGSDVLFGAGVMSGTTWSLVTTTTGLAAGNYTVYAVATDAAGMTTTSSTVLTVFVPGPANDDFANGTVLTGMAVSTTGSNVNATKQSGEPALAGNAGGRSVWWTWTAPVSGTVVVDTHGSSFDTLLGVYEGSAVSAMTVVASDDDDPTMSTVTSLVVFEVVAGKTYHIAVDGFNGAQGSIALNLQEVITPANDDFADAALLAGSVWTGTNISATAESGEPTLMGNAGGASVWVNWTATVSGVVNFSTAGSTFDTLLGVYTGSSVSALTLVAANDDESFGNLTSLVSFTAVAGTTYYVRIDGYDAAQGSIVLTLS
jgi:hypothetical protein